MIRNIYDVTLKFITPSQMGDRIDFTEKEKDILEAVYYFNEKFRMWNKRIIIYMVSKKSIHLLLVMEKEKETDHISAREIRFFTMYLNNEKEWNQYSRNSSKLFESVNFERIDLETAQQQVGAIDEATKLYDSQLEEIEYVKYYEREVGGESSDSADVLVTDEDLLATVQYLVQTKERGRRGDEKRETLDKIKSLVEKWI